jgi:putative sigma-54 modulation protein
MRINITGKNMELTDAIRGYVEDKVGALTKLAKNAGSEPLAEVEVGKISQHHSKGDVFRTEINLSVGGVFLRAEAIKDDLYASIDEAQGDMMRELRARKTKDENLFRRGAAKIKKLLRGE